MLDHPVPNLIKYVWLCHAAGR